MLSQRSERKSSRAANALYRALAIAPAALFGAHAHGAPVITGVSNQYNSYYGGTSVTISCTVTWETNSTASNSIVYCYITTGTSGPWTAFPQWTYGGFCSLNVELDGFDDVGGCDNLALSDDGGTTFSQAAGAP